MVTSKPRNAVGVKVWGHAPGDVSTQVDAKYNITLSISNACYTFIGISLYLRHIILFYFKVIVHDIVVMSLKILFRFSP